MKKFLLLTLSTSTFLLSGCSITPPPQGPMKHKIYSAKLANNKTMYYSYQQPSRAWGCTSVSTEKFNWEVQRMKGASELAGGYEALAKQGIATANQKHINANYFSMSIPTRVDVVGLNVTMMRKATVSYYRCRYFAHQ